jgi:hypothetical protein
MSDRHDPRELPIPENVFKAGTDTQTQELLRLWFVDGKPESMLWRAFEDPRVWGLMLAVVARNLSQVYAQDGSTTQEDVLKRITGGFADALAAPAEPATLKPAGADAE